MNKIATLKKNLNKNFLHLQDWFYDNHMVLNAGKCCYLSFGSNLNKIDFMLEDSTKIPSVEEYVVLVVQ